MFAFAALKADGSIKAWGAKKRGGSGAPSGSGIVLKSSKGIEVRVI
jgi:hypothetical protein